MWRRATVLSSSLLLFACVSQPQSPADESGTGELTDATSADTETETEAETETETATETETGEPDNPCNCSEGQLCAAECYFDMSFERIPPHPKNFRCVDDPACPPEDVDNPACRELVCGSAYIGLREMCGDEDPPGIDILCESDEAYVPCQVALNDCPFDEKCVPRPLDEEGLLTNQCVGGSLGEGDGAPGDPCMRDEDLRDDCDLNSSCWSGELVDGPIEAGTCLAFCTPSCPMGSSCQALDPDGVVELCVPDP